MSTDKRTLLARAVRIILDLEPDDRIDLFKVFPGFKKFFRERRFHGAVRTAGDIVFSFVILSGLFGPQDPSRNVAIFLSWGIWWPTVVLGWFLFGRMWCGFCPFPGLGRVIQGMGLTLSLPVPKALQKYGVYWSVVLFALILWMEETMGLKESPRGTAFLMLSILAGATACAALFPRQAWCRYLCPMGRIIGVGATMSLTEFRPDHEKCRTCPTIACKRGSAAGKGCPVYLGAVGVRNNLECLVCGHCIKLCDRDSPMLNLRSPFSELVMNKGRFITCSFIIPFLMGSQLARFAQDGILAPWINAAGPMAHMAAFSLLLAVGFLFIFGVIRLGAKSFGVTEDEMFGRFSPMIPVLVPLSFAGELVIRLRYSLSQAPDFIPTFGRQFGMDLAAMTFHMPHGFMNVIDIVILASSAIAGGHILSTFTYGDFEGLVGRGRYLAVNGLIAVVLACYLVLDPGLATN